MKRSPIVFVLFLAAALAASACGAPDDTADDGARPDGEAVEDTVAPDEVGDSTTATPDTGSADDPFTGFELEADPTVNAAERRIALLLRNHDARMAIVYADGGAGEVLLDSVPPGAETRVDILSRAGTIALRSVTPEGDLLRNTEVSPGPDTIVDVIVGPPPQAP